MGTSIASLDGFSELNFPYRNIRDRNGGNLDSKKLIILEDMIITAVSKQNNTLIKFILNNYFLFLSFTSNEIANFVLQIFQKIVNKKNKQIITKLYQTNKTAPRQLSIAMSIWVTRDVKILLFLAVFTLL